MNEDIFSMDEQWTDIDSKSWDKIKTAVFVKKGQAFAKQFNQKYAEPCKEGILDLAKEFDSGSCTMWLESNPPTSKAFINGKKFKIEGAIADILYDNQQSDI
jgi:hypothetical protein